MKKPPIQTTDSHEARIAQFAARLADLGTSGAYATPEQMREVITRMHDLELIEMLEEDECDTESKS